jgi:hypothetical protein
MHHRVLPPQWNQQPKHGEFLLTNHNIQRLRRYGEMLRAVSFFPERELGVTEGTKFEQAPNVLDLWGGVEEAAVYPD